MQGLDCHPAKPTRLASMLAALALTATAGSAAERERAVKDDRTRTRVDAPRLEIAVTWDDPEHALPFPSSWVAEELDAQLAPLGVAVRFSHARAFTVTPAESVRVILLERHPLERTQLRNVIGLAHREPEARAVWLLLSSTRRALGLSSTPGAVPLPRESRLLARALARVAAHELVHTLAPDHPHAAAGLMRARLDRRALTESRIEFDPATARILLSALRGGGLPGVRVVKRPSLPPPLAQPSLALLPTVY